MANNEGSQRLQQLRLLWEVSKRQEDYLIRQEEQSIAAARQLISLSGISMLPALFNEIQTFRIPGIVLFTISFVMLGFGLLIGFIDLAKPRGTDIFNLDSFRTQAYEKDEEKYLLTLIDEQKREYGLRRTAEDERIRFLKTGYSFYGLGVILLVIAFCFR